MYIYIYGKSRKLSRSLQIYWHTLLIRISAWNTKFYYYGKQNHCYLCVRVRSMIVLFSYTAKHTCIYFTHVHTVFLPTAGEYVYKTFIIYMCWCNCVSKVHMHVYEYSKKASARQLNLNIISISLVWMLYYVYTFMYAWAAPSSLTI